MTTTQTATRLFLRADQLQPGDRLIKHRVTVASVQVDGDTTDLGYTHAGGTGSWFSDRKFHVLRAA